MTFDKNASKKDPPDKSLIHIKFLALALLTALALPNWAQAQSGASVSSPKKAAHVSRVSKAKAKHGATTPRKGHKPEPATGMAYANRPDTMAWAQDMAIRRDLDPTWVAQAIGQARFSAQVRKLMTPAAVSFQKNWRVYRSRFIDPVRVQAGSAFWARNQATLARAESEYGVPASIIVGIIGVETIYGRDLGNFRVIDALTTLAFDFPPSHKRAAERQQFFLGELEQFLSFTSRSGTDPLALKGSYAGAMGLPQFMPSSWVRSAVDFDGDGKIDLFTSDADAIGSVANYFKNYGWLSGQPTHFEASFNPSQTPSDLADLLAPDILPTFKTASLIAKGVILDDATAKHDGPLALVELKNGPDAASFVLGTHNFYVITRYNWSAYYAMAVIELAREVQATRTGDK